MKHNFFTKQYEYIGSPSSGTLTPNEINRTLSEYMGWSVDKWYTEPVFYKAVRYATSWEHFMPVWQKFRDELFHHDMKRYRTYLSCKEKIEQAILNNNTPLEAAALLAQAVVELKLLK